MIYELINPFDVITFESNNDLIAKSCALIVGHGLFGVHKNNDEIMIPYKSFPDDLQQESELDNNTVNKIIKKYPDEIINCFKSFAVCSVEDRETYKNVTSNYKDKLAMIEWNNKNTKSNANICAFAQSIKLQGGQKNDE